MEGGDSVIGEEQRCLVPHLIGEADEAVDHHSPAGHGGEHPFLDQVEHPLGDFEKGAGYPGRLLRVCLNFPAGEKGSLFFQYIHGLFFADITFKDAAEEAVQGAVAAVD